MNNKKGWDLLIRSIERQQPKEKRSRSQNKKPEEEVEKQVLQWAKMQRIYLHIVESKAVFSQGAGSYLRGQTEPGFPDLVGNDSNGRVLYVELKAFGRRANLSELQYEFLKNKISQGCFAVCVDSSEILNDFYYSWSNSKNPQAYLLSVLPVPSCVSKREKDADPEWGF
jgi:hypothetical protein